VEGFTVGKSEDRSVGGSEDRARAEEFLEVVMELIKLNLSGHENAHLADLGFKHPGVLHVDLTDPNLAQKICDFLLQLGISSDSKVVIALPGLAPLAALIIATIHGLTGDFPIIQTLVRGDEGFVPGPLMDLNAIRELARKSRPGAIIL
jgi:hypothetical protein